MYGVNKQQHGVAAWHGSKRGVMAPWRGGINGGVAAMASGAA
jgi:hypothetical protein